jgi:uncharacterized protein
VFEKIPQLGVGIGYRPELGPAIQANFDAIDWLEVITEHYIQTTEDRLARAERLRQDFTLVPHGIEMSIGSAGVVDQGYVDALARFVSAVDAPWFSDHLCFTRTDEVALGMLTPVPRTYEMAATIARKAKYVQTRVARPFLLENITYYVDLRGNMSEAEFITAVLQESGCGLLLDLTNLFINSINHGYDPIEFLHAIPLDRVVQIHLAGGSWHGSTLIDSHDHPVPEEVWSLLAYVLVKAPVKGILLERDERFPETFHELGRELTRARRLLHEVIAG